METLKQTQQTTPEQFQPAPPPSFKEIAAPRSLHGDVFPDNPNHLPSTASPDHLLPEITSTTPTSANAETTNSRREQTDRIHKMKAAKNAVKSFSHLRDDRELARAKRLPGYARERQPNQPIDTDKIAKSLADAVGRGLGTKK